MCVCFVIFCSFLYVCLMISHKFPPKISGMFVCVYRNGICTLRSWMHTCVNVSVGGMMIPSHIRIHKLWQIYKHRLICMCVWVCFKECMIIKPSKYLLNFQLDCNDFDNIRISAIKQNKRPIVPFYGSETMTIIAWM